MIHVYMNGTVDTTEVGVSITPGAQVTALRKYVNDNGSNATTATPVVVTDHSLDNGTDTGSRIVRPGTTHS